MATKSNLVIDQGSDFTVSLNVTNTDGSAFNLSGYSGACKLRKHWSSNVAHSLTCNTSSDVTNGVVGLSANAAITGNISPGRWSYDVEVTSGTNVTRVLQGVFTVTPGITY